MRFGNKKIFSLVLLSFLFINFFAVFVSAADPADPSDYLSDSSLISDSLPLSSSLPDWLIPISNALNLGDTWNLFIISLIILVIIIAGLYDILTLTSIFQEGKVNLLISIGLSIIFLLTGLVNGITIRMVKFVAGFGAFAIWVEIIAAIVIFIGLSVGSTFISKWAAKKYGNLQIVKAVKGGGEAAAAIKGLRTIQKEFKSNE
jgi:hypothetical protein